MTPAERIAFDALRAALRLVEFGHSAYEDLCPRCKEVRKHGHSDWCEIGAALALADKVEGSGTD